MRNKKLSFRTSGTWVTLLLTTLGCGNVMGPGYIQAPASSYRIAGSSASTTGIDAYGNDTQYECSNLFGINPQMTQFIDGSGTYEICTNINKSDPTDILVHGKTVFSNMICLFPAQEGSSGNLIPIRDPATRQAAYSCSSITAQGVYFSFPSLSKAQIGFNGAFIVESSDQAAMSLCLSHNFSGCPNFSSGLFR